MEYFGNEKKYPVLLTGKHVFFIIFHSTEHIHRIYVMWPIRIQCLWFTTVNRSHVQLLQNNRIASRYRVWTMSNDHSLITCMDTEMPIFTWCYYKKWINSLMHLTSMDFVESCTGNILIKSLSIKKIFKEIGFQSFRHLNINQIFSYSSWIKSRWLVSKMNYEIFYSS